MIALDFSSSYTTLPQCFYAKTMPDKVTHPKLVIWNESLAAELGLSLIPEALRADYFSGNALLPSSDPIALAYAGHQFGHFTMLGDGRAHVIGEINRLDIQLKGSGQTPFSRQGDGKAPLGPMLREYLVSEAMHALGIPTTRSLAVVHTGEFVYRDRPLPGAVLTRISQGHLRVGTFEYAARQSPEILKALVDYAVNRHDHMSHHPTENAEVLLANVIDRQAALIAKWMLVGFVHGVMNTDNISIVGETIDYGPCAFMNEYRLDTVFSSIDHHGRYAYGNQPSIALWNLTMTTVLWFKRDLRLHDNRVLHEALKNEGPSMPIVLIRHRSMRLKGLFGRFLVGVNMCVVFTGIVCLSTPHSII